MRVVMEETKLSKTESDSNDAACSGLSQSRPEMVLMSTGGESRMAS